MKLESDNFGTRVFRSDENANCTMEITPNGHLPIVFLEHDKTACMGHGRLGKVAVKIAARRTPRKDSMIQLEISQLRFTGKRFMESHVSVAIPADFASAFVKAITESTPRTCMPRRVRASPKPKGGRND